MSKSRRDSAMNRKHHWGASSLILRTVVLLAWLGACIADLPLDYADDIYHCDNPSSSQNLITCNDETYEWETDQLLSNAPPVGCTVELIQTSALETVEDAQEPCVLWGMLYGTDWSPPADESNVDAPNMAPNEPPAGEPGDVGSSNLIILDPLALTFAWPPDNLFAFVLDRTELHTLTTRHILEALQAELGLSVVHSLNLILTASSPQEQSRTETLTGNVLLVDGHQELITPERMQASVRKAFTGNAMELYLFRLSIAQDIALRSVLQVVLGTEIPVPNVESPNETNQPENDDSSWSTLMIAVVASVGAALSAVCIFAYCLVCGSSSNSNSGSRKKEKHSSRTAKSDEPLPAVSTNPTDSNDEDVPVAASDNRARNLQTEDDDDDEENQSVGTSVYSYLNNDDTLSAAPSFLYSIHEAENSRDESMEKEIKHERKLQKTNKKGLLWSVMDSFQSAFGNDDESDEDDDVEIGAYPKKKQTINTTLGDDSVQDYEDDDDDKSALTYDDKSAITYGDYSLGPDRTVVDDDASRATTTPVQKRFEALWKEDDENDYLPTTVKKSNRTKVYEDEENESGDHTMTDEESDDSPSTLLNGVLPQPILVDRIPDEEDNKLPLPSALNAASTAQHDTHDETGSVGAGSTGGSVSGSVGSNHSGASSRSSSSRPPFQPANGGGNNVGSVRRKRSNWANPQNNTSISSNRSVTSLKSNKSVQSGKSTDSAKFRSLLNQADTNDAALFLQNNHSGSTDNSEIPATKLSYDMPSPSNSAVQVGALIQSFDKAWKDDDESTIFGEQPFETLEDKSIDGTSIVQSYHREEKKDDDDDSTVFTTTQYPSSTMASF